MSFNLKKPVFVIVQLGTKDNFDACLATLKEVGYDNINMDGAVYMSNLLEGFSGLIAIHNKNTLQMSPKTYNNSFINEIMKFYEIESENIQ